DMVITLKPLLSMKQGQHWRDHYWRGIVGSAGVVERGKGIGGIAWEPEISRHVHVREHRKSDHRLNKDPGPEGVLHAPGSASCETRITEVSVGPGSETNK